MSDFPVHIYRHPFLLIHVVLTTLATTISAEPRVINGTTVNPPHKYPWMVSLYYAGCFSSGTCPPSRHFCGGAILDSRHILTAPHCCFPDPSESDKIHVEDLYVLTAVHERNKLTAYSQNLSIAKCVPHELYSTGRGVTVNDIALLRLNGRIGFSDKIAPVNLPPADFDEVEADEQAIAVLVGFGILRDPVGGEGGLAKELQQVKLPLLSTDTCQRIINQGKDSPSAVTDNMLCAGLLGGWKGGCYGDSGGPIMVLNPVTKTYTQVGITSWVVPPCGGHPTVFTRLSSYVNWVHQHVQKCEPRTLSKVHAS